MRRRRRGVRLRNRRRVVRDGHDGVARALLAPGSPVRARPRMQRRLPQRRRARFRHVPGGGIRARPHARRQHRQGLALHLLQRHPQRRGPLRPSRRVRRPHRQLPPKQHAAPRVRRRRRSMRRQVLLRGRTVLARKGERDGRRVPPHVTVRPRAWLRPPIRTGPAEQAGLEARRVRARDRRVAGDDRPEGQRRGSKLRCVRPDGPQGEGRETQ